MTEEFDQIDVELSHNEFLLPIGYAKDGIRYTIIGLAPIRGKDEEAIADPNVAQNSGRIVTVLVSRCLKYLRTKDGLMLEEKNMEKTVRDMFQVDRDFAFLMLRIISIGEEIEVAFKCPNCGSKITLDVDLTDLPTVFFTEDEPLDKTLELKDGYEDKEGLHKKIKISLTRGTDQEFIAPMLRRNPGKANSVMLARIIKEIEGVRAISTEVTGNMTKRDRDFVQHELAEWAPGVRLEKLVACLDCSEEFTLPVDLSNFFVSK